MNQIRMPHQAIRSAALVLTAISWATPGLTGDDHDAAACAAFSSAREGYYASLTEDDNGLPRATADSVALAWDLIGAAEDCLAAQGIAFQRTSTYAVTISPAADHEVSKKAQWLEQQTGGVTVYDIGFFLRKPFAAGGFEDNVMYLPHSAVVGEIDMVTRHELHHARAHALWLSNDRRLRHLWIFGEDTMFVDEVLAYAEGGLNDENEPAMKTWSLGMAKDYVASTQTLITDRDSRVAIGMEGERCEMSEDLRRDMSSMLDCVTQILDSGDGDLKGLQACDGR